jgi:hypothetical protein
MPPSFLRRRRKALARRLPPLEAILRGSLIERYKHCGSPGCKCRRGKGHGPKYYLSTSRYGNHPHMEYVPLDLRRQVARYLANYRLLQDILAEISAVNRELLLRRKAF